MIATLLVLLLHLFIVEVSNLLRFFVSFLVVSGVNVCCGVNVVIAAGTTIGSPPPPNGSVPTNTTWL